MNNKMTRSELPPWITIRKCSACYLNWNWLVSIGYMCRRIKRYREW